MPNWRKHSPDEKMISLLPALALSNSRNGAGTSAMVVRRHWGMTRSCIFSGRGGSSRALIRWTVLLDASADTNSCKKEEYHEAFFVINQQVFRILSPFILLATSSRSLSQKHFATKVQEVQYFSICSLGLCIQNWVERFKCSSWTVKYFNF